MSNLPPFLVPGDKIAVVATARKISLEELKPFLKLSEQSGFEVLFTPDLFATDNQYAGSDFVRTADFQYWLDNREVKAIICARGGYGTARIIDGIDFSGFVDQPKWLVGFSDFTVIHSHVNCILDIPTLQSTMPVYLKDNNREENLKSFQTLFEVLKGNIPSYLMPENHLNKHGNCSGKLVGGNLSVIYSIMGSVSETDTTDAILFLEDLDEYLYHVDRMMVCLKRAGKLKNLRGLIVGHMSDMHDSKIPFGKTAEEIIRDHMTEFDIPLYFNFDAGHQGLHLPLIFGTQVEIDNNCLNFGNSLL